LLLQWKKKKAGESSIEGLEQTRNEKLEQLVHVAVAVPVVVVVEEESAEWQMLELTTAVFRNDDVS